MPDFIFTVRSVNKNNTFGDNVAGTSYVMTDDAGAYVPECIISQREWVREVITEAEQQAGQINKHGSDATLNNPLFNTDVLIFIHGYNNSVEKVIERHRVLKNGLREKGWKGVVVSFDWPSSDLAAAYLPDRHKAKKTAMELVNGGISLLSKQQSNNCIINVHILAHSTGAFVVREAFDDADNTNLPKSDWMVSQLMFIAGDISANSLRIGNGKSDAIYNHCVRFTNYYNPFDSVLAISNVKRVGVANRVGRVGLPENTPAQCVNVNCGEYYQTICAGKDIFYGHSWYLDDTNKNNQAFIDDLYGTILGNTDRKVMKTRRQEEGEMILVAITG
jgi:esterase/lipase superfamily enzyme